MRIAIAGFQHETNTFVDAPTRLSDFEQADSWPELLSGQDVLDVTRGMNLPIAGFAKAALLDGVDVLPVLWCAAEPGGKVTDHAFDTIAGRIADALADMTPLDGVYLDLHGAMVTESCDDGEGELLSRIRQVIGKDLPLVASLDMHANISGQMVDLSDAMTIFRTYPHLDMADTGARAFRMMLDICSKGPPAKAWRQGEYLIPLHSQYTEIDPAKTLYAALDALDGSGGRLLELAMGFTAADTADCGPSVLAYSASQSDAEALSAQMFEQLQTAEARFDTALLSPKDAVATARRANVKGPVVIADVQDNPGAGASADTTGLLRELVHQNAPSAILGLLHDPQLAAKAHKLGERAEFEAEIGGKGPGDTPFSAQVKVHHLSDGQCSYTGEMYGGGVATLGPSVALQITGTQIHVLVTSIRNQCLDLAQIRLFNLEPEDAKILCVKSTVHFRADFEPIAHKVLVCASPGQFPCELADVSYSKLRAEVGTIE
ncbi:M81 family metallopeptidase [Ruegeria sp. HKCCD4332]|uniref:M81 family metallopeptidase n=1 Tax=Ruegeria sp. HKCCD4332 TaxID=2683021 RepID=UPI00149113FB|nr:M81 family metallopeptidase [Ruegeria sp. HKCCD4332]NOD76390.1 microcystin degradation protein MlrC [Ruegeria sp. HKCCD4332]